MKELSELNNSQLAYRDSEGNLVILPMDDQDVRDAFIRRLMNEYVEDRDLDDLIERFAQSGRDIVNGDTKSIEELES